MGRTTFASREHEDFYHSMLERRGWKDSYHQALFYCLGIAEETRDNVDSLFDFKKDAIRPEGLEEGWQTGGSIRLCRLAFNLWNGYADKGAERMATLYELFDCGYAPYFLEAVRIRYPEYFRQDKALAKLWESQER